MVKKEIFSPEIFLPTKSKQWLKSLVQLSLFAGHPTQNKPGISQIFEIETSYIGTEV
jgi:hypothetical protein